MAEPTTSANWHRTFAALETAAAVAPIGGLSGTGPGTLGSRLKYMYRLLFSSRQKRYNQATVEALRNLAAEVSLTQHAVAGQLAEIRAELVALRTHFNRVENRIELSLQDLAARVTHTEQCICEYRDMVVELEGKTASIGPRKQAG